MDAHKGSIISGSQIDYIFILGVNLNIVTTITNDIVIFHL